MDRYWVEYKQSSNEGYSLKGFYKSKSIAKRIANQLVYPYVRVWSDGDAENIYERLPSDIPSS